MLKGEPKRNMKSSGVDVEKSLYKPSALMRLVLPPQRQRFGDPLESESDGIWKLGSKHQPAVELTNPTTLSTEMQFGPWLRLGATLLAQQKGARFWVDKLYQGSESAPNNLWNPCFCPQPLPSPLRSLCVCGEKKTR